MENTQTSIDEVFEEEEISLLKRARDRFSAGAVYACLEVLAVYDKSKKEGEEWAQKYNGRIDFLRDLLDKAEENKGYSFIYKKDSKRLVSIKPIEDLI